ncbi:MAG TPA: hypothetical protein DD412_06195 [Holosporales bacterium]|nr:hypothetical protein [Holosporales bacterium]
METKSRQLRSFEGTGPKRDNKDYWSTPSAKAYADSSTKTEATRSIEKNKEQEAQIDKGPSLER